LNKEKTVIALGFFDGVHLGHGALLRRTREVAEALGAVPAAFTFDRPPKAVVTGAAVPLINTVDDRIDLMRRLYGIVRVTAAPFDHSMMTRSPESFLDLLREAYGAVHLVAGHDYRFGHRNEGTPAFLQEYCARHGLGCDIIPRVEVDGITVSSTHIRALLRAGEVAQAARFLGHPHCLRQTVCHGKRLGSAMGVPTVNLKPPEGVLLPAGGVYVSRAVTPEGQVLMGVTNVGTRPTVSDAPETWVETHLLSFSGDLYGQPLRLEFLRRVRSERRFDSLAALRQQIGEDIAAAQAYFAQR